MGNACRREKNRQVKYFLENMDVERVQEEIVQSKLLLCQLCYGFLIPPIAYADQIGNMCGFCADKCEEKTLNVPLNTMMKNCFAPCAFVRNGCTEKIKCFSLYAHQKLCKYRNYGCPLDCDQVVLSATLRAHIELQHRDIVVNAVYGRASVDIHYSNYQQIYDKAIIVNDSIFFAKFIFDDNKKNLKCGVVYAGKEGNPAKFTYQITQIGSLILPFELKTDVLHNLQSWNVAFADLFLSISYDFIKQFFAPTLVVEIVVVEKTEPAMLQALQCPICTQVLHPPIYQCITGHSLCNECRQKLTVCSTCKKEFAAIRNYSLEALSDYVNTE